MTRKTSASAVAYPNDSVEGLREVPFRSFFPTGVVSDRGTMRSNKTHARTGGQREPLPASDALHQLSYPSSKPAHRTCDEERPVEQGTKDLVCWDCREDVYYGSGGGDDPPLWHVV